MACFFSALSAPSDMCPVSRANDLVNVVHGDHGGLGASVVPCGSGGHEDVVQCASCGFRSSSVGAIGRVVCGVMGALFSSDDRCIRIVVAD